MVALINKCHAYTLRHLLQRHHKYKRLPHTIGFFPLAPSYTIKDLVYTWSLSSPVANEKDRLDAVIAFSCDVTQ